MVFKKKNVSSPKIGDLKSKIRFAILPVKLSNGDVAWLQRYVKWYRYAVINKSSFWYGSGGLMGNSKGWNRDEDGWLLIEKSLK